jgi:hypothetical protein
VVTVSGSAGAAAWAIDATAAAVICAEIAERSFFTRGLARVSNG